MKSYKRCTLLALLMMVLPLQAQQVRLTSAFRAFTEAGNDVATGDGWAFVGAHGSDVNNTDNGAVMVYQNTESGWQEWGRLLAEDGQDGDLFGYRLAYDQGVLIVSALQDNDFTDGEFTPDVGSVYVFTLDEAGDWQQTAKLVSDRITEERFLGGSLDVHRDRIMVSSAGAESEGDPGAVYVFDSMDGQWQQTARISHQGPGRLSQSDLLIHDDMAFLSVRTGGMDDRSGSVLVYELIDGQWINSDVLESPTGEVDDWFGFALAYQNGTLAVSAPEAVNNVGQVYLYQQAEDGWQLYAQVGTATGRDGALFGYDVDLDDDQLFVGSIHDAGEEPHGAVYVFDRSGDQWLMSDRFTLEEKQSHDDFGNGVAADNHQLIIGAPWLDTFRGAGYAQTITPNPERFNINQGLNGNWFNPQTPGQGLFFDVRPELDYAYLGWFTFNTTAGVTGGALIGANNHRWLVGNGDIDHAEDVIRFDLFYAAGGVFDDSQPVVGPEVSPYGSLVVHFSSCGDGEVSYEIPAENLSGQFNIARPVTGSLAQLCGDLTQQTVVQEAGDFNITLNGHWFNPDTSGQGMFIDQFYGTDQAFLGWFTFEAQPQSTFIQSKVGASGQRWLVGQGEVDDNDPAVLNYQLYYTSGGLFDDPQPVSVEGAEGYGSLRIEFLDCANAVASYEVTEAGLSGQFNMIRLFTDAAQQCPEP